MRRIIMLLAVAAMMAMMMVASAAPAFASPIGPGPNSVESAPVSRALFPEFPVTRNFGRCQSDTAKEPGPASDAQERNPALFTKGEPGFSHDICSKPPK
jgi:hypothetical protein